MAKWLTRWSAKPVFMGSNPIRCSIFFAPSRSGIQTAVSKNQQTYKPSPLRTFPAPWKGFIVLACRKCQKKLKHGSSIPEISNLKKALKQRAMEADNRLHVLQVPCLKLCPKDAVTVCTPHQLARNTCSVVSTSDDLDALYAQCVFEATPSLPRQASPQDRRQSAFHGIFHSR